MGFPVLPSEARVVRLLAVTIAAVVAFGHASVAHAGDLSAWHVVQEFGTFNRSVADGGMKRNVWLRTLTSAIVCSICGM